MANIPGGFILVARQRDNSPIAHCPPHFREIWDYLIRKAAYTDKCMGGTKLKRGQCFVSFQQIQEDLHWHVGYRKETYKKHHCEKAMKYFLKESMAETTKTTRGMIVTILNYNYFQCSDNYESDTESDNEGNKKATMERHYKQEDKEKKEREKTLSSSGDEDQADFYLTKKKRKLSGKRLETFNAFWEAFDFKAGKAEAADAWLDIPSLTGAIVEAIIRAAKAEARRRPLLKQAGRTPKMAQGWISGRRWEDETQHEPDERETRDDGMTREEIERFHERRRANGLE